MDYFISVALVFSTYLYAIGAMLLVWWIAYKVTPIIIDEVETVTTIRKTLNKIGAVLVVVAVVVSVLMSFSSPALTYKHKTLDVERETKKFVDQIEREAEANKDVPLKQLQLQPKKTEEERKRDFDEMTDWRSR